jgi:REP-associated tyrosine transposase
LASPDGAADPPSTRKLEGLTCTIQIASVLYRGFASKLHHRVPHWVEPGALFHIRIAVDREKTHMSLTVAPRAQALLGSARFYETKERWHITLFLLMPDHLHALLSFATDESMSKIIGDWKHFQSRKHGMIWQEGYFDHRLRDDERGQQLSMKIHYIRQNPVAAGLCATPDKWPWVLGRLIPGGSSSPLLDAK